MPFSVLCVDDDIPTLDSLTAVLRHHRYKTLSAENGRKALKMVRANKQISLIVLDFQMPDMNSAKLARRVRRIRPTVPIMVVSGALVRSRDLEDVNAYLEKGWPPDYFLAVVGIAARNASSHSSK
jgi:CheY-like chemotaxis protein